MTSTDTTSGDGWAHDGDGLALLVDGHPTPIPDDLAELLIGPDAAGLSPVAAVDLLTLENRLRHRVALALTDVDSATRRLAAARAAVADQPTGTLRGRRRRHLGQALREAIARHSAATAAFDRARRLLTELRATVTAAAPRSGWLAEAVAGWARGPQPPATVARFASVRAFPGHDMSAPTVPATIPPATSTAAATPATAPRAALPAASWSALLPDLGRDDAPQARPLPMRLRPLHATPLHPHPDAAAVAVLPPEHAPGLPGWVPVIEQRSGWARVLLACRRDGATGWVRLGPDVDTRRHQVHVVVDTRARTLTLHRLGAARTWPIGVGRPASPTPRGRTFVLGEITPTSGLVAHALALAAHAPTHLAHGAGMAAVGVHTWPTATTGLPDTDGCVIVPPAAMPVLTTCALPGTAVLIR